MYRLGYNTNGFKSHPLRLAVEILARIGYQCVAITLDYHALNPRDPNLEKEIAGIDSLLKSCKMGCVIETGAGYLLDPFHKHHPTLISPTRAERLERLDFLKRAVDIAAALEAEAVSFWSGRLPQGGDPRIAWDHLAAGCETLAGHAAAAGVSLALEPEPGMLLESLSQFDRLKQMIAAPNLGLTLDLGHAALTESVPPADCIHRYQGQIRNVHIEDMQPPVHEHLFFGEGCLDFESILAAFHSTGYAGPVCVELSRHSHDAVQTARRAYDFISRLSRPLP